MGAIFSVVGLVVNGIKSAASRPSNTAYLPQQQSNLADFKPQQAEDSDITCFEDSESEDIDESEESIDGEYNQDIAGFDSEGDSITGF